MRIGIDARAAADETGGRGRVVRELLRALAARDDDVTYRLYAHRPFEELRDPRFEWVLRRPRGALWHLRTARDATAHCDVLLSSNSYLTAILCRGPVVPIVYDLVTFDPALRPGRRSVVVERLTLAAAMRRATRVIAISQSTADALNARYPQAAGHVTVAPLGVSPALRRDADDELPELPGDFVLAVGTLEPRKNLPGLVAAYGRLDDALAERHHLVVAGALGWDTGETVRALSSLGTHCHRLGHVSDAQLADLYRRCAVFCYPSFSEGFGLPVLEAMAGGAAVLTSDRPSLPEVGGDACAYVAPDDPGAIAAALAELLRDPQRRAAMGARSRERAAQFTWERFAADVIEVLRAAAA